MYIRDILGAKGSDVIQISPEAPVVELVGLLREHNLGAVVVSPDGRTIAGIVSERDVIRRLADGAGVLEEPVGAVMTSGVHCCSPGDTVHAVMSLMTERRIRHLPVVDTHNQLAGIVSIGDLVKWQISELEFERDQITRYVSS
jgi:CBS domain-containing protein